MGILCSTLTTCFSACTCLSACLGKRSNDNNSNKPITATSGRQRSIILILLSLIITFVFRYGIAPALSSNEAYIVTYFPGGTRLYDAWSNDCDSFGDYDNNRLCREHSGVYRVGFCSFVFFLLATIASKFDPNANRSYWLWKYFGFVLACWAVVYVNNAPLFNDIYLNIARIGASLFILLQQIILIDLAYNWNDYWVVQSNIAERNDGPGAGNKYLAALLTASVIIYTVVVIAIGVLYHIFGGDGCQTSYGFLSITLIGIVLITGIQLSGEEGSLLTSGIVSGYAVYLAFTALTKNPDSECNPMLGGDDTVGIVIGLGFIVISTAWVGYSLTAEERLTAQGVSAANTLIDGDKENYQATTNSTAKNTRPVFGGVVLNSEDEEQQHADGDVVDIDYSVHWKLNVALLLLSCWCSVALTSWGTIESGGNAANPDKGTVAMWMIISSQWLVIALYIWTLIAPKLYPDRDFS